MDVLTRVGLVELAFSPRAATRAWFQVTSLVSFTATSGGLVARRCRRPRAVT